MPVCARCSTRLPLEARNCTECGAPVALVPHETLVAGGTPDEYLSGRAPASLAHPPVPQSSSALGATRIGFALPDALPPAAVPGPRAAPPPSPVGPRVQRERVASRPDAAAAPPSSRRKDHPARVVQVAPSAQRAPGPKQAARVRAGARDARLHTEDLAVLPRRGPRLRLVVGAVALVLAVVAFTAVLLWTRQRTQAVAVGEIDPAGRDVLVVTCTGCEDGDEIVLAGGRARVAAGTARLTPTPPPAIGTSEVTARLVRGTNDRELVVRLDVPLRLEPARDGLGGDHPRIGASVTAAPDATLILDGRPMVLDSAGRGRLDLDLTDQVTGANASTVDATRTVTYSIATGDRTPRTGQLELSFSIAALDVEAPGPTVTTDAATFVLAGRTSPRASVLVSGRPITVDGTGHFAQLMNVSSVGETTVVVRADEPGRASRRFPIQVRRVASLAEEGTRLRAISTSSYATLTTDSASKQGWLVALDGQVTAVTPRERSTEITLDVRSGCPGAHCLASLVAAATVRVEKGASITAFGRLAGDVELGGERVPRVRLDFVLPASTPSR